MKYSLCESNIFDGLVGLFCVADVVSVIPTSSPEELSTLVVDCVLSLVSISSSSSNI